MTGPRILIVDDEPGLRRTLKLFLAQGGYENIGFASSAGEAVDTLATGSIDLVITDISLEDEDCREKNRKGFDVVREASRLGIPSIAVSSVWEEEEVEIELLQLGAAEVIVRGPGYRENLLGKVEELVNG